MSEVQGSAGRDDRESVMIREETKRMRSGIGDLRGKLADLESQVSNRGIRRM